MSENYELTMQAFSQVMSDWGQRAHADMLKVADVAFPGWRERMESDGYLGRRCGWYPAKPKRRRKSARPRHDP